MNLYDDVYQLLNDNDCVIIPGFGGFVANYCEAVIDLSKQKFSPPSRTLAFNQKLQTNDGLLMNSICQSKNVKWDSAKEYVADFVSEINIKLEKDNSLVFGKLGKFEMISDNLVFTPFKNSDLLESSYGLSSFYFPMLKSENKLLEIKRPEIKAKRKKQYRTSKKLIYTVSTAAILTGLVALAIHFDFFDNTFNKEHANIVPVNEMVNNNSDNDTNIKTDEFPDYKTVIGDQILYIDPELITEEYVAENTVTPEIIEPEVKNEVTVDVVEPVIVSGDKVVAYIIAGSFSEYENAESFQKKYKDIGLPSEVLPKSKGMYRVAVKSYTDSSHATVELSDLKNKTGNYSLWILKI
ncbi:MAG TPA: SPOR domain-containing protein [Bacteroidales bacterium]|nr:SPOR domain-containing protein [Bacteroidales bacterium]